MMMRSLFLLPLLLVAGRASCQCDLIAVPGGGVADANGAIDVTRYWDPDGPGPLNQHVVIGGSFSQIGDALARGIAVYDPATQQFDAIGSPGGLSMFSRVTAITVMPNNDLVVAGRFTSIGGVPAENIARWDGTTWHAFGSGIQNGAGALAVLPNGDLVVGGSGPWSTSQILRWTGQQWVALGSMLGGAIEELVVLPSGQLVAGGTNLLPGAIALASWDGVSWSPFPGAVEGTVRGIVQQPNGDLLIAGLVTMAGGVTVNHVARWDGTAWSAFGSGLNSYATSLGVTSSGDVLVGGDFEMAGGVAANRVARWDGTAWQAMGNGLGDPQAGITFPVRSLLELPNGDILAGGEFRFSSGSYDFLSRFDGSSWQPVRPATTGLVYDSLMLANGDRVVVGEFEWFEGTQANHIVRQVGGVWQSMAGGADAPVRAVLEAANGDLFAGGQFTTIGGVAAAGVARWDGSAWHAVGAGLPGPVAELAFGPAGELLAVGGFLDLIAVFDGVAWNGTGIIDFGGGRASLHQDDDGVFASILATSHQGICLWTGFGWQQVSSNESLGGPLTRLADGRFAAADNGVVRIWDGATWTVLTSLGSGTVRALLPLPDGGFLAGGGFYLNSAVEGLLRWDGSAAASVGSGTDGRIHHLRWEPDGAVFVGGEFLELLGESTSAFAQLVTPCPGTVATAGTGCANHVLAADNLPWLGGTFASTATGLPASAVVAEVYGLAPASTPLAAVLPQAGAGCQLLAMPDFVRVALPMAGELELRFAIPNASSLLATTFHQQVVPFELDAQANVVAVTASNALQLTIGQF